MLHLGLRAVSPLLPYRAPEATEYGEVARLLAAGGCRRALVVTGKRVRAHGLIEPLLAALREAGIAAEIFDDVPANPTVSCVETAVSLYRGKGCDCVTAVGGGSPMDCAKGVCARVSSPKKSLGKMKGALHVKGKVPPLVAVPTTAGSGSEATAAAVFTDENTHDKFAVFSFKLVPKFAVLDPALTLSLPPAATAETGMDALTHAVEAFIGRCTTKYSRARAAEAAKNIFSALPAAYADGNDLEAREKMAQAAFAAGEAFTISYVGYVHALAHALGGAYDLPHGRLCAVLLVPVLRAYGKKPWKKLARLAVLCGFCGKGTPKKEAAELFIQKTEELCRAVGVPEKIQIADADIPALVRHAAGEANPLYPVPKILGKKDLAQILHDVQLKKGD